MVSTRLFTCIFVPPLACTSYRALLGCCAAFCLPGVQKTLEWLNLLLEPYRQLFVPAWSAEGPRVAHLLLEPYRQLFVPAWSAEGPGAAKPSLPGKTWKLVSLGRHRDSSQARLIRNVAPEEFAGGRPDYNGNTRSDRIPHSGPNRTVRLVPNFALDRPHTVSVQLGDTPAP